MLNDVAIIKTNRTEYPRSCFEDNYVTDMMAQAFALLKMDEAHYGTDEFNPLSKIIKEGDTVLLKPNLVTHENASGNGTGCLYTQPSVISAAIEWVIKALNGTGKVIVADAPVQACDFERLVSESGLDEVIKHFKNRGTDIELIDFRNVKSKIENGVVLQSRSYDDSGITVDLTGISEFEGLSDTRMENLRVTCYDPRVMKTHHNTKKHEYKVSRIALEADVIINLPKPKTHRKAGMTGCLKNIIGICSDKEYLPHHTAEGKADKGDAYKNRNFFFADKGCSHGQKKHIRERKKVLFGENARIPDSFFG